MWHCCVYEEGSYGVYIQMFRSLMAFVVGVQKVFMRLLYPWFLICTVEPT